MFSNKVKLTAVGQNNDTTTNFTPSPLLLQDERTNQKFSLLKAN